MTYRQEMGRLARELGHLLDEGGRVPGIDIPSAVAGHTAVVNLLRTVHTDVTRPEWSSAAPLGQALFAQPTPTHQPLTPAPSGPAATTTGQRWRTVTEAASAAQYEWHQSSAASRPAAQAAWSEIADLAAIAEAVAHLNGDLADSLAEAGRWADAHAIRKSQPELLEAATKVRAVATANPLPVPPELEPALTSEIVLVPTPEALPQALERLSALTIAALDLPPAQVELISQVAAETASAAARSLRQPGDPAAPALLEHARRLSAVTGFSRRIAPLRMGRGTAAGQAQRIRHFLRNLQLRGTTLPAPIARATARTLTSITEALTDTVDRQLTNGLWLISREHSGALHWTTKPGSHDAQQLLDRLRLAHDHSPTLNHTLESTSNETTVAPRPAPVPRKVLAGPLSHRGSPVHPARAWETLHRNR